MQKRTSYFFGNPYITSSARKSRLIFKRKVWNTGRRAAQQFVCGPPNSERTIRFYDFTPHQIMRRPTTIIKISLHILKFYTIQKLLRKALFSIYLEFRWHQQVEHNFNDFHFHSSFITISLGGKVSVQQKPMVIQETLCSFFANSTETWWYTINGNQGNHHGCLLV